MQCQIPILCPPFLLDRMKDKVKVDSVDYSTDFKYLYLAIADFEKFYKMAKMS